MALSYSKRHLAELIACGHDTRSAAALFNRKELFIKSEQNTAEYKRHLERATQRKQVRAPSVEGGTTQSRLERTYSGQLQ